jgi:hypothetical protein
VIPRLPWRRTNTCWLAHGVRCARALFEEKGTEDCCRRGRLPFQSTTGGAPPEEDDDEEGDDGEEEEGKDSLDGFAVSSSSKEKDAEVQARLKDQREKLEENLTSRTYNTSNHPYM